MSQLVLTLHIDSTPLAVDAIDEIRAELTRHFARVKCLDCLTAVDLEYELSQSSLIARVQPCCEPILDEIALHQACAEEIAAIHGLRVDWRQTRAA